MAKFVMDARVKEFLDHAKSCATQMVRDGRWEDLEEVSVVAARVDRIAPLLALPSDVVVDAAKQ